MFDIRYKTQKRSLLWIHQRLIHLLQNRSQNNGGQSLTGFAAIFHPAEEHHHAR